MNDDWFGSLPARAGRRAAARILTLSILACALGAAAPWVASCGGKANLNADPVGDAPGFCAKACSSTSDCCADGVPDCPGDYPLNFVCEEGLCRAPQCQNDEDCSFGSADGGLGGGLVLTCRAVGGHQACVASCSTDEDCAAAGGLGTGTCSGQADDGTPLCAIPPGAATMGCSSDGDCPVNRHCQSGVCGCAADIECGPSLDVCTKDRDFAYPASAAPGTTSSPP